MENLDDYKNFKAAQKFPTEYVTGHPEIKGHEYVYLLKEPGEIKIIERKLYSDTPPYVTLATIPFEAILAIETEDGTGVEKEFSLGRFMLMGIYSLAWPKKKRKEVGYLTIKWKQEHVEHVTTFKNTDDGALQAVTTARKALLHWVSLPQ